MAPRIVPVQEVLGWHPVHAQDAARIWLRETVARVGEEVGTGEWARPTRRLLGRREARVRVVL
ncbi:hypothetical protein [Streptomyces hundungensis]|uniref:hypothetical protein n=1 Tax=Streptomyces hundungensis TaxID=1077946 RepID=UPI000EAAA4BC|nr:hypothetical protein [Streptomyces hundungensis]